MPANSATSRKSCRTSPQYDTGGTSSAEKSTGQHASWELSCPGRDRSDAPHGELHSHNSTMLANVQAEETARSNDHRASLCDASPCPVLSGACPVAGRRPSEARRRRWRGSGSNSARRSSSPCLFFAPSPSGCGRRRDCG